MAEGYEKLAREVAALEREVGKARCATVAGVVERWRADAMALLFHLRRRDDHRALVAILGGTGTGKSTIVNRLAEKEVSATSFRRTFTSGAVAVAKEAEGVPETWLAVPRQIAKGEELPARGEAGKLLIVPLQGALTERITLVDTSDLDGDQPAHHAEADRVFRWAEAVIFLVTPEKYQMTELLPYYRLARRYALPALFVMNKCEEAGVLEDYRSQLAGREWSDAAVFAVPRDDAAYQPPAEADLPALRKASGELEERLRRMDGEGARKGAMRNRSADLLGRLRDQILAPLGEQRREINRLNEALRAMMAPEPGIDVSPVMRQLQRRLREQSVLYLMGPQRILDRVRQVPGALVRLPRTAWDLLVSGQSSDVESAARAVIPSDVPDFSAILADQMRILQSRIDDLLTTSPAAGFVDTRSAAYKATQIPTDEAAKIAQEELAELKKWLEERWNKPPRDTAVLQKLLKLLPGGRSLTKYSEAAPYLLAVILATHGAIFGPLDLVILGGYSLAVWAGERLSNEVSARTRLANRQIARRFAALAQEQIERVRKWLDAQAPSGAELARLERMANEVEEMARG